MYMLVVRFELECEFETRDGEKEKNEELFDFVSNPVETIEPQPNT